VYKAEVQLSTTEIKPYRAGIMNNYSYWPSTRWVTAAESDRLVIWTRVV